jgi:hypothetical protein
MSTMRSTSPDLHPFREDMHRLHRADEASVLSELCRKRR